jgi:hypothetical protein
MPSDRIKIIRCVSAFTVSFRYSQKSAVNPNPRGQHSDISMLAKMYRGACSFAALSHVTERGVGGDLRMEVEPKVCPIGRPRN